MKKGFQGAQMFEHGISPNWYCFGELLDPFLNRFWTTYGPLLDPVGHPFWDQIGNDFEGP